MREYIPQFSTKELNSLYRHVIRPAILDAWIVIITYTLVFYARTIAFSSLYAENVAFILFAALITVIMLYLFGVYQRIWARTSGHGAVVIINAVATSTLIISLTALLVDPRPLPLSVTFIGGLLSLAGFVSVRFRSRLVSGVVWRWQAIWRNQLPPAKTRVCSSSALAKVGKTWRCV
jgi:FlaA1/EpsC-like NDP-sugar epimerase